jgi:phage terminase large subunit-like protein
MAFPHVVPDEKRKVWGKSGYCIKDTRYDYSVWQRRLIGPDPSFVALSYGSSAIIGMHPSNVLLVDDIHTRDNVESDKELLSVKETITSTIFPTRSPHNPMTMFIATPWKTNDAIQAVKATGEYICKSTPVYLRGTDTPTWPEYYPETKIEKERKQDLTGGLDFARMFLLDLDAAKGQELKREWLHEYAYADIKDSWPVVMGIDPATTADKFRAKKLDRDYAACSMGRLIPGGGVILFDGFRERLSQGELIDKIESMALTYPTFQLAIIETEGGGDAILQLLVHKTSLMIMGANTASKLSDVGSTQSKGDRFTRQMGPLFRSGRVWISDEENEYLFAFRNEWLSWPNADHDDTLDATFYMLHAAMMQGSLAAPKMTSSEVNPWYAPKKRKSASPWSNLHG